VIWSVPRGRGDVGEVRRLLDEEGADIEGRGGCGRTALRLAASTGKRDVVECLLDRGADIEARDEYGRTALIAAASRGHRVVVECLLDRGAETEALTTQGKTAANLTTDAGVRKMILNRESPPRNGRQS
jgi:ankyrin repeat protein